MKIKLFNLFFLFLVNTSLLFSQEIKLKGIIKDSHTGECIKNANVVLSTPEKNEGSFKTKNSTTNSEGEFLFNILQPGKYQLNISHISYVPRKLMFYISEKGITDSTFLINPKNIFFDEIHVTSFKKLLAIKDIPYPMNVINKDQIAQYSSLTAADAAKHIPGVALSRDGIWATSIQIRGLSEQRTVTLVDGIRVETATDLAAGMSMIDLSDIQRIEIIKGSVSSIYGSGAMGGIVHFITQSPEYKEKFYMSGQFSSQYQSVNHMTGSSLRLFTGSPKWKMKLSGHYRNALNTMTPEGILENSQFSEYSFSGELSARITENQEIKLRFQEFRGKDIGIPGGNSFPSPALASYPEETRRLVAAEYHIQFSDSRETKILTRIYNQLIIRDVLLIPNTPPLEVPGKVTIPEKITPRGEHDTYGILVQARQKWGDSHELIAGMESWQRNLSTEREKLIRMNTLDTLGNILSSSQLIRGEIPIPKASYLSNGFFLQDIIHFNKQTRLTIGGRFDMILIRNDQASDPYYLILDGVRNNNPPNQRITYTSGKEVNYSWSMHGGLIRNLSEELVFTVSIAKSFRSPSLEERFKYIDLGNMVRIGDPGLKPEDGFFSDLGIRWTTKKTSVMLNAYMNHLSNLIVEKKGTYIYSYIQGERTDTLEALINTNVDKAVLYGFETDIQVNPFRSILVYASASFTRGINKTSDTNLPLIPPLRGNVGISAPFFNHIKLDFSSSFATKQNKIAEGESDTKGYSVFDLYLKTLPIQVYNLNLSISGGMENIFNKAYFNHLTSNRGLIKYEPGRNIFLKLFLNW